VNGVSRAEVSAGELVTLTVTAAVPPGAGTMSHRAGDVHAKLCRIETIAQARTVVS
jgi:hypothetical protein